MANVPNQPDLSSGGMASETIEYPTGKTHPNPAPHATLEITKTRYVSIHKSFNQAVRKLNLTVNGTKFRFHDLRHVFCTWLLKQGVTIDVIRELVGHRNRSTTDRYATLNRMDLYKYLSYLPEIKDSVPMSAKAS